MKENWGKTGNPLSKEEKDWNYLWRSSQEKERPRREGKVSLSTLKSAGLSQFWQWGEGGTMTLGGRQYVNCHRKSDANEERGGGVF